LKFEGNDTSKYKEVEDRKALSAYVSQAFRDNRKKSRKSQLTKDVKLHNLSKNIWNLSIWSDLARQIYMALMDDGIDSAHEHAEQLFFRLVFNCNRGLLEPISENGENHHKSEKLGITDTADNVDQKERKTTVDTNTMDDFQKMKLKEIYRLTLIPAFAGPNWMQKTLSRNNNDTEAAEAAKSLLRLVNNMGKQAKVEADDDNTAIPAVAAVAAPPVDAEREAETTSN